MKVISVVGARPQFVKAAAVSRKLRNFCNEILVHTGQHYDADMSHIFFEELDIPEPDYNLYCGSASHGRQTADMMIKIEEILLKECPDAVFVYGDTNSTLAAALSASKLNIPVIHVESGLRSFDRKMPEEQNRIVTDHISSLLYCPTDTAVKNLKNEGIQTNVYNIGDVMCDAVIYYSSKLKEDKGYYFSKIRRLDEKKQLPLEQWYITTLHRAEISNRMEDIREVLAALNRLDSKVIFPVHPRMISIIEQLNKESNYENIIFTKPFGYYEMLYFLKNAVKIITDSGGLQKEAYILKTPCVTVRRQTEWIETLIGNYNILAKPQVNDILNKVYNTDIEENHYCNIYGNGDAADKICKILRNNWENILCK